MRFNRNIFQKHEFAPTSVTERYNSITVNSAKVQLAAVPASSCALVDLNQSFLSEQDNNISPEPVSVPSCNVTSLSEIVLATPSQPCNCVMKNLMIWLIF